MSGCLNRFAIALLLVLVIGSQAMAEHSEWRPDPVSRLAALEAALVPVTLRYVDAVDTLRSLSSPGLHEMEAFGVAFRDAWLALQPIAVEGLAVLDAHPPEPCMADYWSALRVGFLKLGDSVAEFPAGDASFSMARTLLGPGTSYADAVRSVTVC